MPRYIVLLTITYLAGCSLTMCFSDRGWGLIALAIVFMGIVTLFSFMVLDNVERNSRAADTPER